MDDERRKVWDRKYYATNRGDILQKSRQVYQCNRETILENRKVVCPLCAKVCSSKWGLRHHLTSRKHAKEVDTLERENESSSPEEVPMPNGGSERVSVLES